MFAPSYYTTESFYPTTPSPMSERRNPYASLPTFSSLELERSSEEVHTRAIQEFNGIFNASERRAEDSKRSREIAEAMQWLNGHSRKGLALYLLLFFKVTAADVPLYSSALKPSSTISTFYATGNTKSAYMRLAAFHLTKPQQAPLHLTMNGTLPYTPSLRHRPQSCPRSSIVRRGLAWTISTAT